MSTIGDIALTPRGTLPLRFTVEKGGSIVGVNRQIGQQELSWPNLRVNLGRTNWYLRPLREQGP